MKVTLPVGGAIVKPAGVTVADNATGVPAVTGLAEEFSEVVVSVSGGAKTVTLTAADVLGPNKLLPPYAAVIKCAPAASDEVDSKAWPVTSRVEVPNTAVPSLKVTDPAGIELALTRAFNVIIWPKVIWVADELNAVVVD